MSIIVSFTCDTDEDLARLLGNLKLEKGILGSKKTVKKSAVAAPKKAKTAKVKPAAKAVKKVTKAVKPAKAKKATPVKAKAKTAKIAKTAKPVKAKKTVAPKAKAKVTAKPKVAAKKAPLKAVKKVVAAKPKKAPGASKPGRKPGKLIPLIDDCIAEVIKKGSPFRTKDVTELVLKKAPELNSSSVITGVSKALTDRKGLKWDQIKDTVGRPYKLYKP